MPFACRVHNVRDRPYERITVTVHRTPPGPRGARRARRTPLAAAGAAALAAALAAPAVAAHSATAELRVVRVSGANPMPQCTTWPANDAQLAAMRDWDVEPALAASPRDPDHLVAAWMTGYSDAIAVGRSDDGGASWAVAGVPVNDCTKYHSTFDPSLAVGADSAGRGEVTYLVTDTAAPPSGVTAPAEALRPTVGTGAYPDTGVAVLTSYDGARTWSAPSWLDRASDVDSIDGTHVVADPFHPGTAYALWTKANIYTFGRDEYVASTADGGRHWSAPVLMPAGPAGTIAIGTRLVVGPGGRLAAVSSAVPQAQYRMVVGGSPRTFGPTTLVVTTAAYGGAWSPRRAVTTMDAARFTNVGVSSDGTGRIAAGWVRVDGAAVQPVLVTSGDGGLTWAAERPAGPAVDSAPFLAGPDIVAPPTVLLDPDGTVSVTFYDHRGDDPAGRADGEAPHLTNVWSRRLDGGRWSEQHVLGPFDGTAGPAGDGSFCDGAGCVPQHSFFGDYFGGALTRKGGTGVLLVASNPLPGSPHNTDVYYARAGQPNG
jgi:hypothetical protein